MKTKAIYWLKSWILRIKQSHKFQRKNKRKQDTFRNSFTVGRERVLETFENGIFPIKK